MVNNITVIVSLITAISAIIAPLITSIISSIKEYKIKTLDLKYQHKIEAMKNFIDAYAELETSKRITFFSFFEKATLKLLTLCKKKKTRKLLIALLNSVYKEGILNNKTDELYSKCIKLLYKEM